MISRLLENILIDKFKKKKSNHYSWGQANRKNNPYKENLQAK